MAAIFVGGAWRPRPGPAMEFPGGGGDTFLTISDSGHPFLSGAETFHTPSLGDEEFEIPPISLPLETDTDVTCHFDLNDANTPQDNGFPNQFSPATLELSLPLAQSLPLPQGVMEAGGTLISSINMELGPSGPPFVGGGGGGPSLAPPITVVTHDPLTTIDQSELSSQLGLGLGGAELLPLPTGPPPGERSPPTQSPASSTHEEEGEEPRRPPLDQRAGEGGSRRGKLARRRRKKDPNEPQKPVSAYALFFRDTQAAIKGQNPSATFGEVSKIVASMWDSLGEEQKQIYKRKTEAAKKEYLKALASYRAGLSAKSPAEGSDGDPPSPTEGSDGDPPSPAEGSDGDPPVCVEESGSPLLLVTTPPTPAPRPLAPAAVVSPRPVSVTTRQMAAVNQGRLTVLPARVLAPAPQLLQLQLPLAAAPQLRMQRLQAPPPLQPMPPLPSRPPPPDPPPLTAGAQHKLRPPLSHPPPLQVQIIQLQQLPTPITLPFTLTPTLSTDTTTPTLSNTTPLIRTQMEPLPQPQVKVVPAPPTLPPPPPTVPVCVRRGCTNCPVTNADWDREYCSSQCVVQHCRDVFMAWVAARNQPPVTTVK